MKTIVFHSYKGGVGRTITLANMAMVLSRLGKRVIVLDLDVDAPGMHNKFINRCRELKNKEITGGYIDYLGYFENKIDYGLSANQEIISRPGRASTEDRITALASYAVKVDARPADAEEPDCLIKSPYFYYLPAGTGDQKYWWSLSSGWFNDLFSIARDDFSSDGNFRMHRHRKFFEEELEIIRGLYPALKNNEEDREGKNTTEYFLIDCKSAREYSSAPLYYWADVVVSMFPTNEEARRGSQRIHKAIRSVTKTSGRNVSIIPAWSRINAHELANNDRIPNDESKEDKDKREQIQCFEKQFYEELCADYRDICREIKQDNDKRQEPRKERTREELEAKVKRKILLLISSAYTTQKEAEEAEEKIDSLLKNIKDTGKIEHDPIIKFIQLTESSDASSDESFMANWKPNRELLRDRWHIKAMTDQVELFHAILMACNDDCDKPISSMEEFEEIDEKIKEEISKQASKLEKRALKLEKYALINRLPVNGELGEKRHKLRAKLKRLLAKHQGIIDSKEVADSGIKNVPDEHISVNADQNRNVLLRDKSLRMLISKLNEQVEDTVKSMLGTTASVEEISKKMEHAFFEAGRAIGHSFGMQMVEDELDDKRLFWELVSDFCTYDSKQAGFGKMEANFPPQKEAAEKFEIIWKNCFLFDDTQKSGSAGMVGILPTGLAFLTGYIQGAVEPLHPENRRYGLGPTFHIDDSEPSLTMNIDCKCVYRGDDAKAPFRTEFSGDATKGDLVFNLTLTS